jgi:hypothetical protein
LIGQILFGLKCFLIFKQNLISIFFKTRNTKNNISKIVDYLPSNHWATKKAAAAAAAPIAIVRKAPEIGS